MQRWLVVVLVVVAASAGVPPDSARSDEMQELKQEIEQLHKRVEELEAEGKRRDTILDQVVTQGMFPGALTIPGTDISVKFGGFVKLNIIHDFDDIDTDNLFATAEIQVDSDRGGETLFDARETRLNLTARSPTPFGDLKVFVEGDFQGSGNALRLRHAYGDVGNFLAGQTNSTFMDGSAQPTTLDNEGPNALVFARHPLVRWTQPIAPGLTWAISVEQPETTITYPFTIEEPGDVQVMANGEAQELYPDLATNVRYSASFGHVQLAGLLRDLRFEGESGSPDDSVTGWGINFTGLISTFKRDALMFQIAYGEGIGIYIQDLSFAGQGTGNDAAPSASGELEAIPAFGAFVAYEHWWATHLHSVATYGFVDVDNTSGQAGNAYKRTHYASLNLVWSPFRLMAVGVEFLYGRRENEDGAEDEARRLQFAVKYFFN
jgi:hypothetical protein